MCVQQKSLPHLACWPCSATSVCACGYKMHLSILKFSSLHVCVLACTYCTAACHSSASLLGLCTNTPIPHSPATSCGAYYVTSRIFTHSLSLFRQVKLSIYFDFFLSYFPFFSSQDLRLVFVLNIWNFRLLRFYENFNSSVTVQITRPKK